MPLYIAAILVMIVVDQVVKHWAFTVLQPQHTIPLIENVFHLTYIENRGAAFSMFAKFVHVGFLLHSQRLLRLQSVTHFRKN